MFILPCAPVLERQSPRGEAAVDDVLGTGDVARFVRGEEHRHTGQLVRFGDASERDQLRGQLTTTQPIGLSVVILLALMTHSEDRHVAWAVDLEQRDVSGAAERYHDLSQQRPVTRPGLAAGKGRVFEQFERRLDGDHGSGCRRGVLIDKERLQALQVLQCLGRETNPKTAHDCLLVDRPRAS